MKIYKLEESGSRTMGIPSFEKFFEDESDARKAFDAKIQEYRKSGDLAKKSDLDGNQPIRIQENPQWFGRKVLREAWASVWDSWETDCGTEHDIGSLRLQIIEVEVVARSAHESPESA